MRSTVMGSIHMRNFVERSRETSVLARIFLAQKEHRTTEAALAEGWR